MGIGAAIRRVAHARRARRRWRSGLPDEVRFWSHWFETGGSEWPEDYAARLDPGLALQTHIADRLVRSAESRPLELLDVGAGPLTVLGKQLDGDPLRITAVDALADAYDELLDRHGVVPPVRTERVEAECLIDRFGPDRFDLTYARNCLDHSYDPVRAIRQMLLVTRPGCRAFLEHAENEGEHEQYVGLHQWNFRVEASGAFVVWRPGMRVDVSASLADVASCEATAEDGWIRVVLTRRSEPLRTAR